MGKKETQKQISQSCDSLESKQTPENCNHEDSHLGQLRGRSNPEMEVIFARDSDEGELLTQIKDKKKELDDLIKKWKNSNNHKTVIDLTATAPDGGNITEKKELSLGSSEIVEVMDTLEKQQECTSIEGTENMQSALVIDPGTEGQEKVVDAVCFSGSESEASSLEEVTALVKQEDGVVDDRKSMEEVETPISTDAPSDVVQDKTNAVSSEALKDVLTTLTANAVIDVVEDKKNTVSPDVLGEVQNTLSVDATTEVDQEDLRQLGTQKDAHFDVNAQDNEEMSVVEKQDSSEEGRVEMDVDEAVAGPSGLPVEWQGATAVGLMQSTVPS